MSGTTIDLAPSSFAILDEALARVNESQTVYCLTPGGLAIASQRIAARVQFHGMPTRAAVCDAQQHGDPWPSSTQPQTQPTSVGYTAIERFLRPIALQDAPQWAIEAKGGGARA